MELIVQVRQHTPMIHFQWDQSGATLRASELKPKLDKFLKERNDPSLKKYFGDKGNLPYKVRIDLGEGTKDVRDIENTYPSFFANIRPNREKKFVFFDGIITIRFLSYNEEVIQTIRESIAKFFFKTNFGMRQTKGFGSFYIDPLDSLYENPSKFENYRFTLGTKEIDPYNKYKKLFESIDLFYRTLRSGINIKSQNKSKDFYFKSIMFLYAKSKNWTWDKKAIKSKFVNAKTLESQSNTFPSSDMLTFLGSNKYLVRDLLGVAPSQAYRSYTFDLQYDKKNEIERFKSPITFKPLNLEVEDKKSTKFTIYLILNSIPDGFFDKEFKINKVTGQTVKSITLKTPPSTELFNIETYLKFALNIDIDKHVDNKSKLNWRFNIIKKIYADLKGGVKNG